MKRLFPSTVNLLLAFILLTSGCGDTTSVCTSVKGEVDGFSIPVHENDALVGFHIEKAALTGDLAGASSAEFTIERFEEDGSMHLTGSHIFRNEAGDFMFRTADQGITTASGQIENNMMIVEGATGTLKTAGSVNQETGAISLVYTGQYCI